MAQSVFASTIPLKVAPSLRYLAAIKSKVAWHRDRLQALFDGTEPAPVTIDVAMTQACNWRCRYCFGLTQRNEQGLIKWKRGVAVKLAKDIFSLGIRGVSIVGDGESTLHESYADFVRALSDLGISVGIGTNGVLLPSRLKVLPIGVKWVRFHISAVNPTAFQKIHGVNPAELDKFKAAVSWAVSQARPKMLIGLQTVADPADFSEIPKVWRMAAQLGVDYYQVKHQSDAEEPILKTDFRGIKSRTKRLTKLLREMALKDQARGVLPPLVLKATKITAGTEKPFKHCWGWPLQLQISGTGIVAPCGHLFREKFKQDFWLGDLNAGDRLIDIVWSKRYKQVYDNLMKADLDKLCGHLCLQWCLNADIQKAVDSGELPKRPKGRVPVDVDFL